MKVTLDNAILRTKMRKLGELEVGRFASRQRFWEREFLRAVYEHYRKWKSTGVANAEGTRLAKLLGVNPRKGSDLIRLIIDCSAQEKRRKVKSRWANALRYADLKNTDPDDFAHLLDEHGGVAGCAQEFTARRKKAVRPKGDQGGDEVED
jgi:hypothetical protein